MVSLPDTMTAIAIRGFGGPDVLTPEQRPVPQPGTGEVLVKVAAAGVNRPDVMQRKGQYPPPKGATDIPGLEISGEVVALGASVTRWKLRDKVMALVVGGGYAEFCRVHESHVLPVPGGLTLVEAAAIPEAFFTVWHNVFQRGGLKAGETLLVHGGASGIGTTAIQLAKAFGARAIATAGSDEKCQACRHLGADPCINYKKEDFVAATKGRLVQIAVQRGAKANIDLVRIMLKRLTHTGSTLRARSVEDKAAIARAVEERVLPLIANGTVRPLIDSTFPLAEAGRAHARMESGVHIGKIVLTLAIS
jgi:NADPH:quinone reductase-like Zn-dependent oxidoreductase